MRDTSTPLPIEQPLPSSSWTDAARGITEHAAFLRVSGSQLFFVRHDHVEHRAGMVLICPTIHAEFSKNYRREVLLARELATRGYSVIRFHYRGTGHSGPLGTSLNLTTMVEDARAAILGMGDAAHPIFVGARWGALVAAAAASDHPGAPVAFWDPITSAGQFQREVLRALVIGKIRERDSGASPRSLAAKLRAAGFLDVLGYRIEEALFEPSTAPPFDELLRSSPRAILVLQMGHKTAIAKELTQLIGRFRSAGSTVDVETFGEREAWWFEVGRWADGTERGRAREDIGIFLVSRTASWVEQVARSGAPEGSR